MRLSDPLHAGALLAGTAAAFWALHLWIPLAFEVGILVFIAAAITLLFARRVAARERRTVRGAAIAALAAHALLVMLVVLEQPFGFGREAGQAVTWGPPGWAVGLTAFYAPIYLFLVAAFTLIAFYPLWGTFERVVGAAGVGLVLLVLVFGGLLATATAPALWMGVLALGFAGLAAASLSAPIRAEAPPWSDPVREPRPTSPAATGNP